MAMTNATQPDDLDPADAPFIVRIMWTTDGMLTPIISISLPADMDEQERAVMLEGIGDAARERDKKATVEVFAGANCEDHACIRPAKMHTPALSVRKNGTPRPPALIPWLIKELPLYRFLPPRPHLKFEVVWMPPKSRETVVDPSLT